MTILLPTLHKSVSTPSLSSDTSKKPQSLLGPLFELIRKPSEHIPGFELSAEEKQHQLLLAKLKNATNYEDWYDAAEKLDELEGNDEWKRESESPYYDSALVRARLEQLRSAMASGDLNRMLFLVRTTLTRGLGDMGNAKLYRHSYTGTKHLIEAYIETALAVLDTILSSPRSPEPHLSPKKILESLISTRQSFGRTALLLSGGATFGMNHVGVVKTLFEADLLPRIVSGASAGSIVASVLCTRTDDEIPYTLAVFPYGDLDVFGHGQQDEGLMDRVARFLKIGAWIDIVHLTRVMRDMLGDMTFYEAYNRTRRILNICVSPASVYELPKLLNYITAPNVLVWSAVVASCSVPFLFSATTIMAKDPKTGMPAPWNPSPRTWIDGSVDNDLPMTRLAELFNVNHFIVSQVNPHVIPFIDKEHVVPSQEPHQSTVDASTWKTTLVSLAVGEALHGMSMLSELGIFRTSLTKARSVLSQKYAGDITIFPEVTISDFSSLLATPTPEFMLGAMLKGQRATWPRLSRIQNHCAIELALDRVIHHMRTRVVFSPSQTDLRLGGWIPNGVYALAGGKMTGNNNANNTANSGFASVRGRGGSQRRRMRSNDPAENSKFNAFIGEQQAAQKLGNTSPSSAGRIRSRSSGPVRWGLGGDMSPVLSRGTTSSGGGGGDYFSLDGITMSTRSNGISMTPMNASGNSSSSKVTSPNATYKDDNTGGELKRSGSRFRLVRQTPTAELDPADAEDESAAVLNSSESDEEPLPDGSFPYLSSAISVPADITSFGINAGGGAISPDASSRVVLSEGLRSIGVLPSRNAGVDNDEDSFDDEGLELDLTDRVDDKEEVEEEEQYNPLSLRRTSSIPYNNNINGTTKSAPGSLRIKMPKQTPVVDETGKPVKTWFSGLPMRSPGSGYATPTMTTMGMVSPPVMNGFTLEGVMRRDGGVGKIDGRSPLSAKSLRSMLFMTPGSSGSSTTSVGGRRKVVGSGGSGVGGWE